MSGYELTRRWFDFAYDKPEAKAIHTALFCWIVELNNKLGWKETFGLPTYSTIECLSIGNKRTYLSALSDLQEWGFIKVLTPSKNQHQSAIIQIIQPISRVKKATALDTALIQHGSQHCNDSIHGSAPIDKPMKPKTINNKQEVFEIFWEKYNKKVGKKATYDKWVKLKDSEIEKILETVDDYVLLHPVYQYRKDPVRYLTNKSWEDELSEPIKNEIGIDLTKFY
jgi:hypothetical protein